jgi:hypothetical protein
MLAKMRIKKSIENLNRNKVLITEANFRTMLSVIRNLKKNDKNLFIYAIGENNSCGIKSKYISERIIAEDDYLYKIKQVAEANPDMIIFPHLEKTYLYIYSQSIKNIVIAPPVEIVYKITNKLEILKEIIKNFPEIVPESVFIDIDKEGIDNALVIIRDFLKNYKKGILKVISEIDRTYGPFNRFVVISEENIEKLSEMDIFLNFLKNNKFLILQRYIEGVGIGIGGLWYKGNIIAIGGHRRLIQSHGKEGISMLAESYINTLALRYSLEIMNYFNYTGIALVEFRLDSKGNIWFMEINPRIWGTISLYVEAGIDIPYLAYKLYKYGEYMQIPITNFKEGVKMIFLKDYVANLYKNQGYSSLIKLIANLPYMLLTCKEGVFDIEDPFPFFYDFWDILGAGLVKIFRNVKRK